MNDIKKNSKILNLCQNYTFSFWFYLQLLQLTNFQVKKIQVNNHETLVEVSNLGLI